MVFTKLSVQEKDAFFGLLDEYFQSRPELFGQNGNGQGVSGLAGTGVSTATAASAIQRALATTGNASGGGAGSASGKLNNNNPYAASMPMPNSADVAHAVTVGRVAAASLAFSGGGLPSQLQSSSSSSSPPPSQSHTKPGDPPSLPRRGALSAPASAPLERVGLPGAEVDKLVTKKASVFSAFRKPETAGVTIPPAFAPPKNSYGPPPVRRATSETSTSTSMDTSTSTSTPALARIGGGAPRLVAPKPNAEEEEGEEEVAEGGWAEVLYDYSSEDPGDLAIEAGTRVFVTDKSSDDWWTGQVEGQGRQGLFPASYVKLL